MLILRRAAAGDELAVATVHVRSWQAAYADLLPADGLAALSPQDRARRYTFDAVPTVIAEANGTIRGFVTYGERDGRAMIWALYVDPGHWDEGLGARLLNCALADLAGQGRRTVDLWVLQGNTRAERFYLRHGLRPTGRTRRETLFGAEVEEFELRAETASS
ncbi:GNAT family N-acetyltransferase [Tsukamurella sp. PLM1]|uniref:GNAT family N-acetyltransferase n=1 Tax=Tsukamurella sp. PLM1 TaxID=2929795 RepID=UPI0020620626|nr:GNAT family N-acetyltransferase [Tsukamurella sp. PLM1]BDH59416.1 N-acetyltransferase [Tsukamurella sp. PLM1]